MNRLISRTQSVPVTHKDRKAHGNGGKHFCLQIRWRRTSAVALAGVLVFGSDDDDLEKESTYADSTACLTRSG